MLTESCPLIAFRLTGIVFVVFGQVLRSVAMIHAATNFSHSVAYYKVEGHRLVTDGIYR